MVSLFLEGDYPGIQRSRGITPHILNLGTKWIWALNFTLLLLDRRKRNALNMKLDLTARTFRRWEKLLAPNGIFISFIVFLIFYFLYFSCMVLLSLLFLFLCLHSTIHTSRTSMPSAGFKPPKPSKLAATSPHLRPHGHRIGTIQPLDRPSRSIVAIWARLTWQQVFYILYILFKSSISKTEYQDHLIADTNYYKYMKWFVSCFFYNTSLIPPVKTTMTSIIVGDRVEFSCWSWFYQPCAHQSKIMYVMAE